MNPEKIESVAKMILEETKVKLRAQQMSADISVTQFSDIQAFAEFAYSNQFLRYLQSRFIGIPALQANTAHSLPPLIVRRKHLHWMLTRILDFQRTNRDEKSRVWLGFIAGVLFCTDGHYEMNRTDRRIFVIELLYAKFLLKKTLKDAPHISSEEVLTVLGMAQGILWNNGIYTIDELRSLNMP